MPNRILRDGILSSEGVDRLGDQAEVFYRRLMSVVDDFGRFSADPRILWSTLYPLRPNLFRADTVERQLRRLAEEDLIRLYRADGKPYLVFNRFRQSIRAEKSRCPDPPPADATQPHSIGDADAKPPRPYSESYSETESKTFVCGAPASPDAPPKVEPAPPKADPKGEPSEWTFLTVGGKPWTLTVSQLRSLEETFPTLDVDASLRRARKWCEDNPEQRKTPRGMTRFLSRWCGGDVDRGRCLKGGRPAGGSRGTLIGAHPLPTRLVAASAPASPGPDARPIDRDAWEGMVDRLVADGVDSRNADTWIRPCRAYSLPIEGESAALVFAPRDRMGLEVLEEEERLLPATKNLGFGSFLILPPVEATGPA